MKIPVIDRDSKDGDINYKPPNSFPIGPNFVKYEHNPILTPNPDNEFENSYLYNATAIVIDDRVFLLYRAQNQDKVSSVGIAWSNDGYKFVRWNKPIIKPTESYEKGGCEDPRIVRDPVSKLFIMTYTAYDTKNARLCIATSENLFDWTKYPPIINPDSDWHDIAISSDNKEIIRTGWSKSGAIFVEKHNDGKYYMIWGDSAFHLAESTDLISWKLTSKTYEKNIFAKGVFNWQDKLIEPGAAPIKLQYEHSTKNHYVLFYNSATKGSGDYPKGTYSISQMLVDYDDLSGPLARLDKPFLVPDSDNEVEGQVDQVVFTEGIVQFHGKWFLYFGQGDSELGVATCDA
ncbi:DEHA2E21890p [Debaryomyces hansenii CBS767]|uniref:DEHA2E21890p n=1 Tax=Debaryomyces hansenii (strain ATCC 36239 / CBS 767 / BCRC 21394 / JCM 1990 / NBRC 0083 / IGC 2968) TaxID=284592 RepID=Q6BNG7_DEBHA|nr:DEHA2E21890p [Debaryomyces hansenii CBS767]CAG88529.2 DEHA2E21890p [Debaryomyces hansenii CBS767]|eukprot:XP_460253.2 DEHA2E21890p [Debaryomyces hansenii CBS767]